MANDMDVDALEYRRRDICGWSVPVVEFIDPARDALHLVVYGEIANSVSNSETGRNRLNNWKVQVASEVKATRGEGSWNPRNEYAVSITLSFAGGRGGDVDNYIKPIIDAIAAGLFCEPHKDPSTITYWGYDDSNFKTLFAHRLPDTDDSEAEGVAISVSAR